LPAEPARGTQFDRGMAESKNSKELGRCRLPPHEVPRESGANDGETVPRRAEIVDDAVLRQLDRTFEMRSTRSGGSRCMSWRRAFCM